MHYFKVQLTTSMPQVYPILYIWFLGHTVLYIEKDYIHLQHKMKEYIVERYLDTSGSTAQN